MKLKSILIFLSLFTMLSLAFSQDKKAKYYSVVPVLTPEIYTLSSQSRTLIGGKNATSIHLNLPTNTEKWYYTFSTFKKEQKGTSSNLLTEVTKLYQNGIYTGIIEALTKPTGVYTCNVEITEGGYKSQGSREMLSSGTVEVIPNTKYQPTLKFINPNAVEAVQLQVEVVAIVFDKDKYTSDQLSQSFKNLDSAISDYSEASRKSREEKQRKERDEMKSYLDLGYLKIEKEDYDAAINIFLELAKKGKYYDYIAYQGLGIAYRRKGEYDLAIKSYQKSLKENDDNEAYKARSYGGMGLTYLLKGDEVNANKSYAEALAHATGEKGIEEKKLMVTAIEKAKEKNQNLKGSEDIVQLLSN